ncbi:uncharacterized protein LOC121871491 isoform X4 [Homarus americanus]|uniref:uncharacterized protein LOC121871491 isoform X4 n=1 Tax=Homarus americanus TaxID=6706 RepID=UPI001C482938|nr:uncharacterized protein LOC121871491 isoform X4 [Homarus americanus]
MPTFLLLLLGLTAGCVRTQDSSEGIPAAVASPLKKAKAGPGDPCEDLCGPGTHTICDNKTKTCKCDKHHPVAIDNKFCVKPVQLGKPCVHHDQCQFHDVHAICREYAINYTECQCREKYEIKALQGQGFSQPNLCFPDLDSLKADVPTLLGLGLGMSVLSALICLVLKIFARARFVRPRRYADAHINPPLTVSETYAAFALAANASTSSSPARGRTHSLRSSTKSASSSRRPSYSSLQALRPGTRRSSQASLRLVVGEGRGEPIGYYVCIRDPASVHSRGGSRRPSQASVASSSGDLREGRVHHYLYMRAPNYSLTSETNTTTTGTSDSSPRTPKSTEQLLAVYHSVPELLVQYTCDTVHPGSYQADSRRVCGSYLYAVKSHWGKGECGWSQLQLTPLIQYIHSLPTHTGIPVHHFALVWNSWLQKKSTNVTKGTAK